MIDDDADVVNGNPENKANEDAFEDCSTRQYRTAGGSALFFCWFGPAVVQAWRAAIRGFAYPQFLSMFWT